MKTNLDELIDGWREGTLSEEELRRLSEALSSREARAALRDEWLLEAGLPEALKTQPVLRMAREAGLQPERRRLPWTRWQLASLAAAATICVACIFWERMAPRPNDMDAFAARLMAATLEP